MQDKKSSVSPRHASRVVRRRLREAEVFIPADTMRRAVGFILKWLRLRARRSAAAVARQLRVAPQTVRDIETGNYEDCGWTKVYGNAHVLRRRLYTVERLAERFLAHDYQHECRLHAGEANWRYRFPWSKKRAMPGIRCRVRQNPAQ